MHTTRTHARYSPWLALLLLTLASPGLAALSGGRSPGGVPVELADRQVLAGSIDLQSGDLSTTWRLNVDRSAYAVHLAVQDATADLDLQVFDSRDRLVWSAATSDFNEQLWLYRLGNPALEDGDYTVKVAWLQDYRPSWRGEALQKISFRIACDVVQAATPAALVMGSARTDRLQPDRCMMQALVLNVPAGTRELRIAAWSRNADIDLFAQWDRPFADPRDVELVSQSYRPREGLQVSLPAGSKGGKLYLMAVSNQDAVPADLTVLASPGSQVPVELAGLPVLDGALRQTISPGLDRATRACVEIITDGGGGSGAVISPDGWIITNRHVVAGGSGELPARVTIGFSVDHSLPPDCQFWARVVASDTARDLALLRIEATFYEQALPPAYRFPFVELGSGRSLHIGQELFFAGYPTIGGLGSRPTFTLTDGKVNGFQDRGFGVLVKSAAEISAGNSGGAALDEDWRLVGLPTIVASDETSRLAFIYPVELIPPEWLKMAGLKSLN